MMKICALTMVYRDHWALSQWYMHYGHQLGHENLFIIAHGPDKKLAKICPKAQIFTIPRDDLNTFDTTRGKILNDFQTILSEDYDRVIQTDADELICLDPQHFTSFADLLAQHSHKALFALGLEIAQQPHEPEIPRSTPVLQHRTGAIFSGHYSKAWVTKGPTKLVRHGYQVRKPRVGHAPFCLPQGVYLAHLKYADTKALARANRHRLQVATTTGTAMPGTAWSKAKKTSDKFYRKFKSFPNRPWEEAVTDSYTQISANPVRNPKTGIIRARSLRFEYTTTLPKWFKTLTL